jgi:hypothetical protein
MLRRPAKGPKCVQPVSGRTSGAQCQLAQNSTDRDREEHGGVSAAVFKMRRCGGLKDQAPWGFGGTPQKSPPAPSTQSILVLKARPTKIRVDRRAWRNHLGCLEVSAGLQRPSGVHRGVWRPCATPEGLQRQSWRLQGIWMLR